MVDVLLVNSPVKYPEIDGHARMQPPLGLAYIGAVLLENDTSVLALDMNVLHKDVQSDDLSSIAQSILSDQLVPRLARTRHPLKNLVKREKPRIVGISTYTQTYLNALEIARTVKAVDPEIITVLGGPHVTFLPADAMKRSEVDIVVRNEGEFTMLELVKYYKDQLGSLKEIKGINFRRQGKCVATPARPSIENLDALPYPARHLLPLHSYRYPGNLLTARGCPAQCIFCAAGAMSGRKYRMRSPRNVVNELVNLYEELKLRHFTFADDTFTVFRDRTLKICDLIKESGLNMSWGCSTRVNTVTKEILERMAKSGCDNINFGVESGNQRILNSIKKGVTLKQVRDAVKWTRELEMIPVCSFMMPHPDDTLETILETKKFMKELLELGADVSLTLTTPFPGTYLYNHAKELGVTITSDNWDDFDCCTAVVATKYLSQKEIYSSIADITYR